MFLCLFWRFKARESDVFKITVGLAQKCREREQGIQLGDSQITVPSRTFRQKSRICPIHSHKKILALERIVFEQSLSQI